MECADEQKRDSHSPQIPVLPSGYRDTISNGDVDVLIYYLGCLAQASYIVRDRKAKTAFIIDPRRDIDIYLQELEAHRSRLKGVFLTHVHADFVSGHMELSRRGDADIYMGPGIKGRATNEILELADEQTVQLSSNYSMNAVHTPGHTPESTTWLLTRHSEQDAEPTPLYAFTGDTLFIGSCGRPDLVGSLGHTAKEMATLMHVSLWNRLMKLPDDVKVFPAHGAGSPCGKSLSDALWSTIGQERCTNPALQIPDVDEFVSYLTTGQPHSPQYFIHSVQKNLAGAESLKAEILSVPWLLAASALEELAANPDGAVILDTREATEFAAGHLPRSMNVGKGGKGGTVVLAHEGNFAIWVGTLIAQSCDIYVITPPGDEFEALQRLARIGYKAKAVVTGGVEEWRAAGLPLETHSLVYPMDEADLTAMQTEDTAVLVDVRTPDEYATNHIKDAISCPLATVKDYIPSADSSKTYYTYCVSGFRSSIAASVLNAAGLKAVDVQGGFANLSVRFQEHTVTGKVCPVMRKTAAQLEEMFSARQ